MTAPALQFIRKVYCPKCRAFRGLEKSDGTGPKDDGCHARPYDPKDCPLIVASAETVYRKAKP